MGVVVVVIIFFIICLPGDKIRGGGAMRTKIVNVPENSASSSPAGSPGQSSSSSISAHSGRSAWPWHKAGLTHGWGLVATRTSCFSETVVLNEKGISLNMYYGLCNSMHLLVRHDVGHQFGIRRHLSGGDRDRMLSKKPVMLRRPGDAQGHISTTAWVQVGGETGLMERSALRVRPETKCTYRRRIIWRLPQTFTVIEDEGRVLIVLGSRTVRLVLGVVVGEKAIRLWTGGEVEGVGLGVERMHVHGGQDEDGDWG